MPEVLARLSFVFAGLSENEFIEREPP